MRWVPISSLDLTSGDAVLLDLNDGKGGKARVAARVLEADEVGVYMEQIAVRSGGIPKFVPFKVVYNFHAQLKDARFAYCPSESPTDRVRRRHHDPHRWLRAKVLEAAGHDMARLAAVVDPEGKPVGDRDAGRVFGYGVPVAQPREFMLRGLRQSVGPDTND